MTPVHTHVKNVLCVEILKNYKNMVETVGSIISHLNSKNFNLKQYLTCKNYGIYVAECKFCKMEYVGQTKNNFLPDEITTAHFERNLTLKMIMIELPSLIIFINFISTFLMLNRTSLNALWSYL